MSEKEYTFPAYFHLPPFFTIQPNLIVKKKQLEMWADVILNYTRENKIFKINLNEPNKLFINEKINRKLSVESAREVIDFLVSEGYAEWIKGGKDIARVYWKKPEEWGDIIYRWVVDSGQIDSVFTLYELREGESAEGEEFYGLDNGTLIRAIRILEKNKKAQIFKGNEADSVGVKFFA